VQRIRSASEHHEIGGDVRTLAIGVPAVVACGGLVLSSLDLRLGLAAGAVVIGWTKLVGL
jgi:hypothetical protein